jgi:hypothetical protein
MRWPLRGIQNPARHAEYSKTLFRRLFRGAQVPTGASLPVLFTSIEILFVASFAASYTANLFRRNREKLRQQDVELVHAIELLQKEMTDRSMVILGARRIYSQDHQWARRIEAARPLSLPHPSRGLGGHFHPGYRIRPEEGRLGAGGLQGGRIQADSEWLGKRNAFRVLIPLSRSSRKRIGKWTPKGFIPASAPWI